MLRCGGTVAYKRSGWQQRATRSYDARLVRVLAFEQAFSKLTSGEQSLLLFAYRDGISSGTVSHIAACSVPFAQASLHAARLRLANILDRRDLL